MNKDSDLYKKLSNWKMNTIQSLYEEKKFHQLLDFLAQEMPIPNIVLDKNNVPWEINWKEPKTAQEVASFLITIIRDMILNSASDVWSDLLNTNSYLQEVASRFFGIRVVVDKAQPKVIVSIAEDASSSAMLMPAEPTDFPTIPHEMNLNGKQFVLLKNGKYRQA